MNPFDFGHGTDTGKIRDHNEDAYCADPELGLWMVADGMGGHDGGEVASAVAVEAVKTTVGSGLPLKTAVGNAHHAITEAAAMGAGIAGMGSTAVAMKTDGFRYEIAWVGDSRGYLWNGDLKQLTRDHSFVQRLIDAGALSEADARNHPQRNVVTQALGAEGMPDVEVDVLEGTFYRGQKILLCSDGLTGELEDDQIAGILSSDGTDQDRVHRLIRAANDNGGEDNITVILVSAPPEAPDKPSKGNTAPMNARELNREIRKNHQRRLLLLFLALFTFLASAALLFLHYNQSTKPPAVSFTDNPISTPKFSAPPTVKSRLPSPGEPLLPKADAPEVKPVEDEGNTPPTIKVPQKDDHEGDNDNPEGISAEEKSAAKPLGKIKVRE